MVAEWNEALRALDYECSQCGAKRYKRCKLKHVSGSVQLLARPHTPRAETAWRAFLAEQQERA